MDTKDITYVLINTIHDEVESATTNDFEAWKTYRDSKELRMQVFINGNLTATIEPAK